MGCLGSSAEERRESESMLRNIDGIFLISTASASKEFVVLYDVSSGQP